MLNIQRIGVNQNYVRFMGNQNKDGNTQPVKTTTETKGNPSFSGVNKLNSSEKNLLKCLVEGFKKIIPDAPNNDITPEKFKKIMGIPSNGDYEISKNKILGYFDNGMIL